MWVASGQAINQQKTIIMTESPVYNAIAGCLDNHNICFPELLCFLVCFPHCSQSDLFKTPFHALIFLSDVRAKTYITSRAQCRPFMAGSCMSTSPTTSRTSFLLILYAPGLFQSLKFSILLSTPRSWHTYSPYLDAISFPSLPQHFLLLMETPIHG